jgi:murein DD-endopeptidase MepM/ murein hydrolase activator NlpD
MGRLPIFFAVSSFVFAASSASAGLYRLPWPPGLSMELTQDCNDSFYADHVGSGRNAWDFANGTHFQISAARDGIVTHVKMSSHAGCESASCVDLANYIVVDHGDGTASLYLHVDGDSLDENVRCGQPVHQGQHLATAGSTGWSTGPHLHFQVNAVHANDNHLCECGERGTDCPESEASWGSFWSSAKYPSVPITFDEWSASACDDRRISLPISQNVDEPVDSRLVTIDRFGARVFGKQPSKPLVVIGIGGRKWPRPAFSDKSRRQFPEILQPSPRAPSAEPARR